MSDPDVPDIATLTSDIVYENRWMRVREDWTQFRDGSTGLYGYVDKPDFAIVAPICSGRVHLVQQFRYPIRARHWEFPQGSFDARSLEQASHVAAEELEQETGLRAARILEVGHLYPLYGTVNQSYRIFLASDLFQGQPHREREEQDLITQSFDLQTFEEMLRNGTIQDAGTMASYGLLKLKGLV